MKYYKLKLAAAEEKIKQLSGKSLSPDEVPGFYKVDRIKPKRTTSKAKRVTQVHGSLEGTEILELLKEFEAKKKMKIEAKEKRDQKKSSYFRCKIVCNCDVTPCEASGLKQCKYCKVVKKSRFSRKSCNIDGKKPSMMPVVYDV